MTNGDVEVVEVALRGLPVEVHRRTAEHSDELQREFALLRAGSDDRDSVPARLLILVEELGSRYQGFTENTRQELLDAMDQGAESIDLVYRVPREIRDATIHLGDLLDEADEFCRAGDLLTLATPPDALAYRRWFLSEFVRQIDGHPPTPWAEFTP